MLLQRILMLTACFIIPAQGACMSIPSLNPFKKEVYLMSPLKGQLVKDGEPLANTALEVMLSMPRGEQRTFAHQTDENGFFDLPAITEKMHVGPMTEFAVSQYVFALIDGEKVRLWYAGKREPELHGEFTPPGEPVDLVCDLDAEQITHREMAGVILTKCKWKTIRRL